jgi:ankyrin repeat protein
MEHANSYDEIRRLIELCKAGRLFDVQEWIAEGKPVNLPLEREKRARRKSPLKIAMEKGFHSLVQVLVEGGAQLEEEGYSALDHAISERRLDLIKLLVSNRADIHSVSMVVVFEC